MLAKTMPIDFDEENYKLAKMALINDYRDPALCAKLYLIVLYVLCLL